MILAGDIGGTKTHLALFNGGSREPLHLATYRSGEHEGLPAMVEAFLADHPADVSHASFGVAGPVQDGHSRAVNLPWTVDADELAAVLGLPDVTLMNDLEANAHGIAALGPEDFAVLNEGEPEAAGHAAVISAGTGLGEAGLYWDGDRHHVVASEGGHVDFAPTNELEVELYLHLAARWGRVSYERVLSGQGLVNIHRFLLDSGRGAESPWMHAELEGADPAAAISRAALEYRSANCVRALDLFVSLYGAKAGNLALTFAATGGVYLGGGIAPKILPRLREGAFMRAFVDKGRFSSFLERVPVRVILNDKAALLGAARASVASSHQPTPARFE
jgi:glucokinase